MKFTAALITTLIVSAFGTELRGLDSSEERVNVAKITSRLKAAVDSSNNRDLNIAQLGGASMLKQIKFEPASQNDAKLVGTLKFKKLVADPGNGGDRKQ